MTFFDSSFIIFVTVSMKSIDSGQTPEECAIDIYRAVLRGDNEITPWKYIGGVWLRSLLPAIYFRHIEGRARAFEARNKDEHIV